MTTKITIDTDRPKKHVVMMYEMKPLAVGIIQDPSMRETDGGFVMRTASTDSPEVISLSSPGEGMCWTWDPNNANHSGPDIPVEIINAEITIKIR